MKDIFSFNKFKPSYADQQICSNILNTIDELAPSDSNVIATIDKLADGTYHTIIDVESFCGRFLSEAKNFSLVSSLKEAQNIMLENFQDWKNHRFSDETPEVIHEKKCMEDV